MSIAVLYGGARNQGNSEILTEIAVNHLPVERIYLRNYNIQPIKDGRHSKNGFQKVNDDYHTVIDQILPHEIIIFSTPIYWYSMSATMKLFIDRWSQTLRDADYPRFKEIMAGKKAYVIAVGGDSPSIKGLPLIQQFNYIFEFMGITFSGYIIGEGNKPGDILHDENAIHAATQLNKVLLT